MSTELTPDEIAFFETGTLPASMLTAPAPTPEPAPAPAPVPEPSPATPIDPSPSPTPTPAEILQRLEQEQARRADLEARLAAFEQRASAPTPQTPEPAPDSTTDPLGHMMHQLERISRQQEAQANAHQQLSLKQQLTEFTAQVQAAKAAFEARTPDFGAAYAHIRALRAEDLRAAGAPEADIPKILLQDELQIAQTALQRGHNPAEELYKMAKRYGFAAPSAPAPPADASKPAALPADQQLARIAAVAATVPPPKAGPDPALTLDGLKDASNSDLNRLVLDDTAWKTIVGGVPSHELM